MNIFTLLILLSIAYSGSIIFKTLFYYANVYKVSNINYSFILIPFSLAQVSRYIEKKYLFTPITKKMGLFLEILAILSFVFFALGIINQLQNGIFGVDESLFFVLVNFYALLIFLYFSITDILRLEISRKLSLSFAISIIVISVITALYKLIVFRTTGDSVFSNINFGDLQFLLTGLVLSSFVLIFRRLNRKSFGKPEVELMLVFGFLLGPINSLIGVASFSIIGTLYSIVRFFRNKKIKSIVIPFAPFLMLGFLIAMGFGENIVSFLLKL